MTVQKEKHFVAPSLSLRYVSTSKYIFAALLVILVEWLHYEWYHLNSSNVIGNGLFLIFFYVISVAVVDWLRKLFVDDRLLKNIELRNSISKIINRAEDYICLVSPYLNLGNELTESIIKAVGKGVEVTLIHNSRAVEQNSPPAEIKRLLEAGCHLYHHPNLHAKVYFNERYFMMGSVNLLIGSFENSFELGMISNDRNWFQQIHKYTNDILASDITRPTTVDDAEPRAGFCIRCKSEIRYDYSHPYCSNCFKSWAVQKDTTSKEANCHHCGAEYEATINEPLCAGCAKGAVSGQ